MSIDGNTYPGATILVVASKNTMKGDAMGTTIFDTDFQPEDEVLLYDGSRFHWSGKVKDMTEADKMDYDVSTWFLLDAIEGFKALFVR